MRLLTVILALSMVLPVFGQSNEKLFRQANGQYEDKLYGEAIDSYQQILENGVESAALYYNLGNCYYKTNQLASAILNYERALRIDPYDEEIQQNLKVAQRATIDKFEEMPKPIVKATSQAIMKALTPAGWAIFALIGFAMLIVGTYLYLFTSIRRPGFTSGLFGLLIALFGFTMSYLHQSYIEDNKPAIVMSASSYVKSGPGDKAEDVFILHEGARVTVTEAYRDWRKIRLPDGKVGWISAPDVERI